MVNIFTIYKKLAPKYSKPFFLEKTRKNFLLTIISLIGIAVAGFFSVLGFLEEDFLYSILLIIFSLIIAANLLYLRLYPRKYKVSGMLAVLFIFFLGLYLFLIGGRENTGALWHFALIPIAFFIIGKKRGLIFSALLLFSTLVLYYFYHLPVEFPKYSTTFMLRYIFIYIVVTSVIYIYEFARERTDKALQEKQKELNEILVQTIQQNEEIKAQSELLAETNRKLEQHAIAASETDNSIAILDLNGNFQWVNKAFEEMFADKFNKAELHSYNILEFSSRKDIRKIWNNCINKKVTNNYESSYTNPKSKSKIYLQTTLTPIINSDGNIQKAVVVESDITELKKVEKKLKQLNKTLEKRVEREVFKNRKKDLLMLQQNRLAAMGEMLSNIAHQWRQPLNAIGVIVQNIQQAYEYGDFSRKYLEKNVNKTMEMIQYMSQTIEDFQHFFKPDKEIQLFEINQTVNKAINFVEASFKVKNIEIQANMPETVIIKGYPNEYIQAIINILNNARDALLDSDTKNPKIIINLKKINKTSELRISNNGPQINDKTGDRIYDPYFSTKDVDKGTGLGLYMSKNIIEKNMQGKLFFNNTNNGVEFIIQI